MARNPKKNVSQPKLPDLPLNPFHGQNFPTLTRDGSPVNVFDGRDPLRPSSFGDTPSLGGGGTPDPNVNHLLYGFTKKSQNEKGSTYADMLNHNATDEFSQFLASLGIKQDVGLDGSQRDAWNNYLLQTMIQQYLEQNSRDYNRALQIDQRIYDSPTNQLARLMGAGISRDAAIQLLSGGSGSGSASPIVGSAAGAGDMAAANEAGKMPIENTLSPINTALNVVSTISGLVSMGFSIPQAIQQTNALKYANAMSKEQLGGYNASQKAFSVLHSIGASADAFGSVAGAIEAINSAVATNQGAAQFVANGGIDELKKYPTFASDYLRKTYHSERDAKDYSRQMDEYFAQQEARTEIEQTNAAKSHLEYEQCVMQLLQMDADLQKTYQAIRNGEIEIEINGVRLQRAKNDLSVDQLQTDAYLEAMHGNVDGSVSGKQMLSESIWRELFGHWRKLSIEQSPENYDKYEKFLQDNWDAACAVATIKAATSSQLADAWNAEDNNSASVWTRFTNIFFGTKTDQMVNLVGDAAKVGTNLYLGIHNKNFVQ